MIYWLSHSHNEFEFTRTQLKKKGKVLPNCWQGTQLVLEFLDSAKKIMKNTPIPYLVL